MAQRITLAIDRQNKTLVSFEGSISTLPVLFQRDTQPLLIKIVDPDPDAPPGTSGYVMPIDLVNAKPRVTIASQATGTNDDESIYLLARTLETGFDTVVDGDSHHWTGTLSINTDEMAAHLGALDSRAAVLEVRLNADYGDENTISTVLQIPITIRANADEGGNAPTSILNSMPAFTLPLYLNSPDSGYVYAISETAPGTLTFVVVTTP